MNHIKVVGGGSAGWMAAATLIRCFPDKSITLIESPNINTVGVGESTLGQIRGWTSLLGIDDKDFITNREVQPLICPSVLSPTPTVLIFGLSISVIDLSGKHLIRVAAAIQPALPPPTTLI
jgi:hypothetical protein